MSLENNNHPLTNGTYDDHSLPLCSKCNKPIVCAEDMKMCGELSYCHKNCTNVTTHDLGEFMATVVPNFLPVLARCDTEDPMYPSVQQKFIVKSVKNERGNIILELKEVSEEDS